MNRRPATRFPFPDQPERKPAFPAEAPLDSPIWRLSAWWLDARCDCGRHAVMPFRLMSAERGWDVTLAAVLARLVCGDCGRRPGQLAILEDPAHGAGGMGRGWTDQGRLTLQRPR